MVSVAAYLDLQLSGRDAAGGAALPAARRQQRPQAAARVVPGAARAAPRHCQRHHLLLRGLRVGRAGGAGPPVRAALRQVRATRGRRNHYIVRPSACVIVWVYDHSLAVGPSYL